MSHYYRKQEEVRLEIPGGQWILVRKHLTAGEERAAEAKLIKGGAAKAGEKFDIDYEELGIAQAVTYLLDWSITDADEKPIVIRDKPYGFVAAALRNMTTDGCRTILEAISAHDAAMAAERAHEKKDPAGENVPSQTSTSVA